MSMNSFHARNTRSAPVRQEKPPVERQRKGVRADVRVVELGLATSRNEARRLIEAGLVSSPAGPVGKPAQELPPDMLLTLLSADQPLD